MTRPSGNSRGGPLKTYSRRASNITTEITSSKRKHPETLQLVEELPPAKRFARSSIQSYFQPLSSSSSPALRSPQSDNLELRSTPPSSPPLTATSPIPQLRRFQKRPKRRLTTKLILQLSANMVSGAPCTRCIDRECTCLGDDTDSQRPASPSPSRPGRTLSHSGSHRVGMSTNSRLVQTQIAGGKTIIHCGRCNHLYNCTDADDRAQHKEKHDKSAKTNFEFSLTKLESLVPHGCLEIISKGPGKLQEFRICVIDRTASLVIKDFAEDVVNKMNGEFAGKPEIDDGLWGEVPNLDGMLPHYVPEYKVCIALLDEEVIGVVVVRSINKGSVYIHATQSVSKVTYPCHMSVDRLWVEEDHRGPQDLGLMLPGHVATQLLEAARQNFVKGYIIPRNEIAISFPTGQGYKFARRYFDGVFGSGEEFLVHLENESEDCDEDSG